MKTEDQIKGRIAEIEAEIQSLTSHHEAQARQHQQAIAQFNQTQSKNVITYNQLQGELKALKDLFQKEPKIEVVPDPPKVNG